MWRELAGPAGEHGACEGALQSPLGGICSSTGGLRYNGLRLCAQHQRVIAAASNTPWVRCLAAIEVVDPDKLVAYHGFRRSQTPAIFWWEGIGAGVQDQLLHALAYPPQLPPGHPRFVDVIGARSHVKNPAAGAFVTGEIAFVDIYTAFSRLRKDGRAPVGADIVWAELFNDELEALGMRALAGMTQMYETKASFWTPDPSPVPTGEWKSPSDWYARFSDDTVPTAKQPNGKRHVVSSLKSYACCSGTPKEPSTVMSVAAFLAGDCCSACVRQLERDTLSRYGGPRWYRPDDPHQPGAMSVEGKAILLGYQQACEEENERRLAYRSGLLEAPEYYRW